MEALQSHAVVSGELLYALNLPITKAPSFNYNQLRGQYLTDAPVGTCWIIFAYGKTAGFMTKWGKNITENMSYPDAARVHHDDVDTLCEVGAAVWDAVYRSKRIITTVLVRG